MKIFVVTPNFGVGDTPLGRLYAKTFSKLGRQIF